MTDLSVKLSAYLDGELDPVETEAIEARLDTDPAAQAELDELILAQVVAQEQFDAQLNHPVPLTLVKKIKKATPPARPVSSRPVWSALAASLVAFFMGAVGGYVVKDRVTPIQTAGWLSAIADYHGIYASQERHLVEVNADEADHIEAWLGKTVGAKFTIPDLTELSLTFEGGRLLVANGKPVAQLMYRQENGTIVALCLQRSNSIHNGTPTFKESTINGFDLVSWSARGADYVVIGPSGQPNLGDVATRAALDI